MDTFEEKRDRFDADLRAGQIGCMFGAEAARNDRVTYLPFLESGSPEHLRENGDAVVRFIRDAAQSVLVLIPQDSNPDAFNEGKEYAYEQIFRFLIHAVRAQSGHVLSDIRSEEEGDRIVEAIVEFLPRNIIIPEKRLETLLARPDVREIVCNTFIQEGDVALGYLKNDRGSLDDDVLMPLTLAPYYTPVQGGKQHPRFARDFAVVVTRDSEIRDAMSHRKKEAAALSRWKESAVGHDYKQEGLHIPLRPDPGAVTSAHISLGP